MQILITLGIKKPLYRFSVPAQDEMQQKRIAAVKQKYCAFLKNLEKAARIEGQTVFRYQVLAHGYYDILASAGYDGILEEPAY